MQQLKDKDKKVAMADQEQNDAPINPLTSVELNSHLQKRGQGAQLKQNNAMQGSILKSSPQFLHEGTSSGGGNSFKNGLV